jgi:hypothetical protein
LEIAVFRRSWPAIVAGAIASLLAIGSVSADPGTKILDASLTSIPTANQIILGVQGGGLPWRIDRGDARLFADGRLEVSVQGLVFATGPNAGRNTVPTGRAIVACSGADSGVTPILTDLVPFSADGDARVETTVDLPSTCLAPVIFFAGQTGAGPRWFAATGS